MLDALSAQVLRLLKVPPRPATPRERVRVFRASRRFFHYNLAKWGLKQASALAGIVIGFAVLRAAPGAVPQAAMDWIRFGEIVAAVVFVAQLPVTFAMLRLDFDLRWYIVGERSLRIREGIVTVREQTISFANIQNMSIRQGPLQQLLRIADLEVHTAGGGAGGAEGKPQHVGRRLNVGTFRGVDDAAEIRDAIRARVRAFRDSGLGDPDDARTPAPAEAEAAAREGESPVDAARLVLQEARALRSAFAPQA
jgi:membrane protein YdbS with pleckstrin-like domain